MYCRKCGKEVTDNSKFCSGCGTPIKDNVNEQRSAKQANRQHKICQNQKAFISIAAGVFVILIIVLVVTLRVDKTVSKKEISDDLAEYSNFAGLDMSIQEYEEVKRDTDKKNKYDHIWVNVVAENDEIAYSASYYIVYGLYNSGWILESIEILNDDYYALEMITIEQISEDLQAANKSVVANYGLEKINVGTEIPELNREMKSLHFVCDATAENAEMSVSATVEATYRLYMSVDKCGWVLTNSQITDYSYEAKTTPSSDLLEETTSGWTDNYELLTEGKVASNTYVYTYEEHDEEGFLNVIVDWKNTLTYKYDPDKGGWYLADEKYEVTDAELEVEGYWVYTDGNEYVKLNVISANAEEINYDLDVAIVPTNILHIGNQPVTSSGTGKTKSWTYEYIDEEELCLVFTASEPVFTISYVGGSYTDEYTLYYKAYLGEVMGTSGFYLDGMLLTKSN